MAGLYERELFSRLKFHVVDGDTEVDEGIHLLFVPGHSPGTQAVAVSTAKGTAIITGFCCTMDTFVMPEEVTGYVWEDLDQHVNALQAFDSALRIKGLADIVIPMHEPSFEKVEKIPG